MGKKKYTTEITDIFGKDINPKQVLKLAKNIKSTQGLAYPNTEYKTRLKDRLHNMYLIDQGGEVVSRFSIFQMFGAFASFAFIAGTLLMVSDMRHDSEQIIHQDMMIEESVNINKSEQDITSISALQEEKEEEIQMIKKIVTEKNTPQQQETEDIFIPEAMETYKQVGEDLDETVLPAENTDMPTEEMHFGSMMIDNRGGENLENGFNMFMEDGQAIYEYFLEEFLRICDENNGNVSEDQYSCVLEDNTVCTQDNIGPDSAQPCEALYGKKNPEYEDEINLEELIEAYGQ